MLLFTEHGKKRVKDTIIVIGFGIFLWGVMKWNIFHAIGLVYVVLTAIDIVFTLLGHLLARVMCQEEFPTNVKELKHTDKQYQYILRIKGKDIYTYVYDKPLKAVKVRAWSLFGKYFIEVTRSKETV